MIDWIKKISSHFVKGGSFFFEIEELVGVRPKKSDPYKLALRHSSASTNEQGEKINNQRLEYLGDAILGAVVADYLYEHYPRAGEGFLTNMRSKIVSRKNLNQVAIQIGLHKMVVKKTSGKTQAKSIYGDAMEALIGAIYLDRGYQSCKNFIIDKILLEKIDIKSLERRIASHKGALLEWGQKNRQPISFKMTGCWGESHARRYEICVTLNGEIMSTGKGSSKKKAEEEAARMAYKKVKVN
jgi:ribonuclease-3